MPRCVVAQGLDPSRFNRTTGIGSIAPEWYGEQVFPIEYLVDGPISARKSDERFRFAADKDQDGSKTQQHRPSGRVEHIDEDRIPKHARNAFERRPQASQARLMERDPKIADFGDEPPLIGNRPRAVMDQDDEPQRQAEQADEAKNKTYHVTVALW